MRLVCHILPRDRIHEPRQLGEMHGVEVEEVPALAEASNRGINRVQLTRGHDAIIDG